MDLLIRLAGPVQTWVAYRPLHKRASTEPLPTISGLAGLLGACCGERNYLALIEQFTARVRVDRTNPAEVDLQVATPPAPGPATVRWYRTDSLHQSTQALAANFTPAAYKATKIKIAGTPDPIYSPNRTFLPHAEFTVHIHTSQDLGQRLAAGFTRPAFMPYLGRMANAPTFPFWLGAWVTEGDPLAALPHVTRPNEPAAPTTQLRVHTLTGNYAAPASTVDLVTAPTVIDRQAQLDWAKEHLIR